MATTARMTILTVLVALGAVGAASAQGTKMQAQPQQGTVQVGGEQSLTGKVFQVAGACFTCATPEVRFCMSADAKPTTCQTWFVFANPAKDEVRSAYAAVLTAVSADKPLTVMWQTGPTVGGANQVALSPAQLRALHATPAGARPITRVIVQAN